MSENTDQCPNACRNPACPYLTQINENTQVTHQTHLALIALLGEDCTGLNGGIIRTLFDKISELAKCQQQEHTSEAIQKSWVRNLKAFGALAASVVFTALFEYWLLKGF
ncbi:MAG: hypothetical protein ACLQO7_03450 [Candidatus Bathyarchaeia archaeon]